MVNAYVPSFQQHPVIYAYHLQLQTSDFVDCRFGLITAMAPANPALKMGYLRICWSHGSDHSPNPQSTKSEVCNCKLMFINNQVLLDDGNRIIIPQGNFNAFGRWAHINVKLYFSL